MSHESRNLYEEREHDPGRTEKHLRTNKNKPVVA
jgi:hypothetical protein